jgi:hypothetical protein
MNSDMQKEIKPSHELTDLLRATRMIAIELRKKIEKKEITDSLLKTNIVEFLHYYDAFEKKD